MIRSAQKFCKDSCKFVGEACCAGHVGLQAKLNIISAYKKELMV